MFVDANSLNKEPTAKTKHRHLEYSQSYMKQNLCSLIEKYIPHPQSCLGSCKAKEKLLVVNENIRIFLLRRKCLRERGREQQSNL